MTRRNVGPADPAGPADSTGSTGTAGSTGSAGSAGSTKGVAAGSAASASRSSASTGATGSAASSGTSAGTGTTSTGTATGATGATRATGTGTTGSGSAGTTSGGGSGTAPVAPLPRLYESVVDRVLEVVGERGIQPGQALPTERELAGVLGVSRNVLRQAFGVLEERGIVVSRRGSGRYLREVDGGHQPARSSDLEVASIADILEARIILEGHVAALACQRRTMDEARHLVALAARLSSWQDNLEFHTAIAAASHNFALERLCRQQAELQGELHPRDHYEDADELDRMRAEHHEIAMAVAGRDETRARELVQRHLERTRAVVATDDTDGAG